MEFGLSERERILREFGIGELEAWYVGAIDERIYADEILKKPKSIQVTSAKHEENRIKIELDVSSRKGKEIYKVTLFLEKTHEKEGASYYFVKMDESEHKCLETDFRRREADHHVLAAGEYVKMNLSKIGKKYMLGNVESFTKHKAIPPTIVDYFYRCKYIDANDRLKDVYAYISQRYEKENRVVL